MVSLHERGFDVRCQVRYADRRLNNLLGEESFVFSLPEGLKEPAGAVSEAIRILVVSTTEAIRKYLRNCPPPAESSVLLAR